MQIRQNALLANTALEKLSRHGWFLEQSVVPLTLFSDHLGAEEKEKLAEKQGQLPATGPGAPGTAACLPSGDAGDQAVGPGGRAELHVFRHSRLQLAAAPSGGVG